ncbi:MAG: glycerate dehydrogenase [Oxalobacteraceae bacterium]|nr:MAG: glycerate dehydrogenase [Oxalobacteraceae bacterium]
MHRIAHRIVFLDRDSLLAHVRRPAFEHDWQDHAATAPHDVVERLRGATIAITNKVPLRAPELAQLPELKMIAVAATGTDNVDLAGSRLGIVGYGALGRRVAQIGRAFGMEIAVASRSPVNDTDVIALPLPELLATADVVSLHLPLNDQTRNMIGARELASMKNSSILINTARGGLVDEAALAKALTDGVIAGAGFDVLSKEPPLPENPLLALRLPNFVLTPHVAWASGGAMQTLADMLVDNIEAWVAGAPTNVVA